MAAYPREVGQWGNEREPRMAYDGERGKPDKPAEADNDR